MNVSPHNSLKHACRHSLDCRIFALYRSNRQNGTQPTFFNRRILLYGNIISYSSFWFSACQHGEALVGCTRAITAVLPTKTTPQAEGLILTSYKYQQMWCQYFNRRVDCKIWTTVRGCSFIKVFRFVESLWDNRICIYP